MVHRYFFAAVICISSLSAATHKIVIQVSPPRCLSTAALRMWQARGDFAIMNEPLLSAFAMREEGLRHMTNGWWDEDAPQTFQEAYQRITDLAEQGPVFVKEISFGLVEFLRSQPEVLANPNIHFVFLLRHPHGVVSSQYKAHQKIYERFSYSCGFQACYEILRTVQELGVNKPYIMKSEDLYNQPQETAQALCKAIDIPFAEHMLHWDNLGSSFIGRKEWHELKHPAFIYKWHEPAIMSTGFHQPTLYDVDEMGNPTFAEVINEEDRKACFEAYDENMIYYKLMTLE